ncbi:MAG: SLBB domain-containing protein [Cyanobacteria bacterium SBC]|nr:SLBB domain-containing protein [Cyanobacteria bacterium SBC]
MFAVRGLSIAILSLGFAPLPLRAETSEMTSLPYFEEAAPGIPAETQPPPAQPNLTPPPEIPTYFLSSGDGLQITIFGVPDYSGNYTVGLDNTINLPVVGLVDVGGLTLQEAQDLISQQYARILRRPIVTLNLVAPRPLRIAISGEVSSPGSYTLSPQGSSDFPRLTQALQNAGGITQSGDLSRVELRRRYPEPQTIVLNLWDLTQNGDLSQDPMLFDGDSIVVPTLDAIDPELSRRLESTNIAAEPATALPVAVVGEVFRPGTYTVGGGGASPTVTEAIETAGGITALANIREIRLYRRTQSGDTQTIELDFWAMLQLGDLSQDPILQAGDSILIPTAVEILPEEALALASASFSPDNISINVVGEAVRPGQLQLSPNTPLNEAILAAGGFNRRARRRVTLVRLNPNGTVSRRRISVDFEDSINDETNPILQHDDIIVVGRNTFTAVSDTLSNVVRPIGNIFIFDRFFQLFNTSGN